MADKRVHTIEVKAKEHSKTQELQLQTLEEVLERRGKQASSKANVNKKTSNQNLSKIQQIQKAMEKNPQKEQGNLSERENHHDMELQKMERRRRRL